MATFPGRRWTFRLSRPYRTILRNLGWALSDVAAVLAATSRAARRRDDAADRTYYTTVVSGSDEAEGSALASWSAAMPVVGVAWAAVLFTGCGGDDAEAVLARGEQLYEMHCVACHGGATGGHITDIPPPHNAEGHTWHHADCDLVDIVLTGMPQREGFPEMPAFGDRLTEDEVETILAYIKTWWEPDQREFQAEVTEQLCDQE